MRAVRTHELRRLAEWQTVGEPEKATRALHRRLKKEWTRTREIVLSGRRR